MNAQILSKLVTKPLFVSLIIFLFSAVVMVLLAIPLYNYFEKEQYQRTIRIATDMAAKISFELHSRMNLNKATASFIEQTPNLNQKLFSNFVSSLIQHDNGGVISSMAFEPDLVLTLVAPYEFNKKALGLDLTSNAERYEGLKKAIALQKAFVEGPFELAQGNIGICSYIPVFIVDTATDEKISIGVTDVVMLWERFLDVTGLNKDDDIVEFALRGKNGKGMAGEVFYGDSAIFDKKHIVTINIPLPLGEWVLAAHSKEDWKAAIIPFAIMFVLTLTFLFSSLVYLILKYGHKQIKRSERKYRYIAERSKDTLWTFDAATMRFTYASEACLENTGYTPEEFCNLPIKESHPPESYATIIREINNATDRLQQGITKIAEANFEIQQYTKYGTLNWIDVTARATTNDDGEIEEVVGSSRVINDRKRLEIEVLQKKEELDKANVTKNKFFSIIAHDLKNPISSLAKLAETLEADYRNNKMEYLEDDIIMMGDTTKQTYKLLENLLDWTRSQMDTIAYNPILTSLPKIISDCVNYLNLQAKAKKIEIKFSEEECFVNCDVNMIHTVLRNLISNAIKFSFKNSTVEVIISEYVKDSNYVQVSVSDSGVGIDFESVGKLFRIDEKIISSRGTSDEAGTGLGLILCKEFIDKHNCEIWVESVKGEGTTFCFTLARQVVV